MDNRIPDRLTFTRGDVTRITKLDGRVVDYWENEFGGISPVVNKLGEKFYTRQDIQLILKIKELLIEKKIDKSQIKNIIAEEAVKSSENGGNISDSSLSEYKLALKQVRKGLEEILTILDKNGKK